MVLSNLLCLLGPRDAAAVKFFSFPLTSVRPLVPLWSHSYSPAESTREPNLGTAHSRLLPLLGLQGHKLNTPLCWGKDMAMPRGSKHTRDWHHANQGDISMNYFVTIQDCLHAEARGITVSIPLSVFLMRLQRGSSSAHRKSACSSITGTGLE